MDEAALSDFLRRCGLLANFPTQRTGGNDRVAFSLSKWYHTIVVLIHINTTRRFAG